MRLILIAIGAAVLCAIYFYGRWQYRRRTRITVREPGFAAGEPVPAGDPGGADPARMEQELADLERLIAEDKTATPRGKAAAEATAHKSAPKDKLVILHVVAREGRRFAGAEVRRAFENEEFRFGTMGIYHRMAPLSWDADAEPRPVFSVANLAEPGTFDPDTMTTAEIKGLTLFLRLPGPVDGSSAFQGMLASAQRLAAALNGRLWDSTHSSLSHQMIQHIEDDIRGYEYRQKIRQGA